VLPAGAFQTRWGVLPPHVVFVYTPQGDSNIPTSIFALIRWVSAPSEALIRQETDQTKTKTTNEGCGCRWLCRLPTPGGVKPPLGRKVTTADADHCRALGRRTQCYTKGHRECGEGCLAPDRLQWVRNGLTLTTADDYNSKVLSARGGAGQRVGYTKTGLRASPNRITQNHKRKKGGYIFI
jgi:hypothetical protein